MFGTWHIIWPCTRDVAAEGAHVSGDQRAAAALLLLLSPDCTLTHVSTSHRLAPALVWSGMENSDTVNWSWPSWFCSRGRILTIECSCEPDQDMSQQCTGAGSLALAHQQPHCRLQSTGGGGVKVMWGFIIVQECREYYKYFIGFRSSFCLNPTHSPQLNCMQYPLISAPCCEVSPCASLQPGGLGACFQISDFWAKHCSIATLQRSIRASGSCSTAACILPHRVLSNLFVLQLWPYSGQMTPSIFTQNIKIQA